MIRDFLEGSVTISRTPVEQELELPDDLFACIIGYDDVKDEIKFTLGEGKGSHYLHDRAASYSQEPLFDGARQAKWSISSYRLNNDRPGGLLMHYLPISQKS